MEWCWTQIRVSVVAIARKIEAALRDKAVVVVVSVVVVNVDVVVVVVSAKEVAAPF
jgi:hypothetical protein